MGKRKYDHSRVPALVREVFPDLPNPITLGKYHARLREMYPSLRSAPSYPEYVRAVGRKRARFLYRPHRDVEWQAFYNLRLADYELLLEKQEGRCALCQWSEEQLGYDLVIDHCHESNAIRGLLCHNCNSILGKAGDSPEVLQRCIAYLEHHSSCGEGYNRVAGWQANNSQQGQNAMAYAIEKNVPMPGSATTQNFAPTYNWNEMNEVGDSFFVGEETAPEGDANLTKLRQRIYNAARAYGKPRNMEFKALVVEETKPNPEYEAIEAANMETGDVMKTITVRGVRCWLMSLPPVAEPTRTDENDQSRDPQV